MARHFLTVMMGSALIATLPALAQQTAHVPPGDPCGSGPGKGTGNPCNGNNGNSGHQGNAGKGKGGGNPHQPQPSPPILIDMPAVSNRAAHIDQIGDANRATIVQTAAHAYARIGQRGDRNRADVEQKGSATSYVEVDQDGDDNQALAKIGKAHV